MKIVRYRSGGRYISGNGDTEVLELLDLARRVYSSGEYEYQSVNMLYNGGLDGLLEGPTWGAWWTQVRGPPARVRSSLARHLPPNVRSVLALRVAELVWNHHGLAAVYGGDHMARHAALDGMVV